MKTDLKTVDRIAALAKLRFEGQEREDICNDLDNILNLCEKLEKVDTSQTKPLIFVSDEVNRLRNDQSGPPVSREEALKNAPEKDSDYFKVPKFR